VLAEFQRVQTDKLRLEAHLQQLERVHPGHAQQRGGMASRWREDLIRRCKYVADVDGLKLLMFDMCTS
jgi:hypothetical protein